MTPDIDKDTTAQACEFELEILAEIRDHRPRPWGAAVGAALEACKGNGWINASHQLTEAGRKQLNRTKD